MNPLFTLGEEFRFHDSSRFREKAGDAKLPFYHSFVPVLMSLAAESCRSRAESVHLLEPHLQWGKSWKSSNFVTPDDSARNRKMRKIFFGFFGRRPLPFGGSHLRLPSGPAGFEPPPAVCQRWQDQRHTNWAIGSPTARCARWCHWTVRFVWCPFLGLERYIEFGLPKAVLPSCVESLLLKQNPTLIYLRNVKSFVVFRAGRKVPHCQKWDCHVLPLFALDRAISRLFSISILIAGETKNGRAKSTRWSVWQSCFWGCDMTLGTHPAASKVRQKPWNHKRQEGWHKHPRAELWRTTFWSPKSQCVYGPENEIAAVTFFAKNGAALTKSNTLASVTEWQDSGEHGCWLKVSSPACMLPIFAKAPCCLELFGCFCRRLSQHGVGEVLIPLRHCLRDASFCVCVGSGSFCHDWASHCSVLFWSLDALFVFGLPPSPP